MAQDCPPNFILYIVYNTAKITLTIQLNMWLLKRATQFYMQGLYLKKLNGEVKEHYRLKSNGLQLWRTHRRHQQGLGKYQNINISAEDRLGIYEGGGDINHGCIQNVGTSADQGNQAKLQWLQEHSQLNGGKLYNMKCETTDISATRTF